MSEFRAIVNWSLFHKLSDFTPHENIKRISNQKDLCSRQESREMYDMAAVFHFLFVH